MPAHEIGDAPRESVPCLTFCVGRLFTSPFLGAAQRLRKRGQGGVVSQALMLKCLERRRKARVPFASMFPIERVGIGAQVLTLLIAVPLLIIVQIERATIFPELLAVIGGGGAKRLSPIGEITIGVLAQGQPDKGKALVVR